MQLQEIKGLGLTTIKYLNELGIYNVDDLINYYPFRYEILENTDPKDIQDQSKIIIGGLTENIPSVFHFNRKLNKMSFHLNTGNFIANVIIFNRAFLKPKLKIGTTITVIGKYDQKHNTITASDIKFGLINKTVIEPIYHSSFKISSSKISKLISKALPYISITNFLPDSIINKYHFMDRKKAIQTVHNPKDKQTLNKALELLKYEELFTFMLKIGNLKNKQKKATGLSRIVPYDKIESFIGTLPFKLTKDQLLEFHKVKKLLLWLHKM